MRRPASILTAPLQIWRQRKSAGAAGPYPGEAFFAIISRDVLYFKVSDANRTAYDAREMQRFRPSRPSPDPSMSYYEVPADTSEDPADCAIWTRRRRDATKVVRGTPS